MLNRLSYDCDVCVKMCVKYLFSWEIFFVNWPEVATRRQWRHVHLNNKLKLLIRNQTFAFRWYECRWPWRHFKVIKLFHIKFLINGALYGKRYYSNRKSYTSFRLVPVLTTLKYIWRSFQSRLSFPRPFQQSLSCFRVARSPSNSWASCYLYTML